MEEGNRNVKWTEDFSVLFGEDGWRHFFPWNEHTPAQQFNATSRLIIYSAAVYYLLRHDSRAWKYGLGTLTGYAVLMQGSDGKSKSLSSSSSKKETVPSEAGDAKADTKEIEAQLKLREQIEAGPRQRENRKIYIPSEKARIYGSRPQRRIADQAETDFFFTQDHAGPSRFVSSRKNLQANN